MAYFLLTPRAFYDAVNRVYYRRIVEVCMEILLVEDDNDLGELITEIVRGCGHHCVATHCGRDALSEMNKHIFDLVLLDIFLPDAMGYDLIPRFREIQPEIRVITMTGENSPELEKRFRNLDIIYYLIKPFEINHLQTILNHISKKKNEQIL